MLPVPAIRSWWPTHLVKSWGLFLSTAAGALFLGLCCLCFPKLWWGQWEGGPLPFFPPPHVCTAFRVLLPPGSLSLSPR